MGEESQNELLQECFRGIYLVHWTDELSILVGLGGLFYYKFVDTKILL